MPTIHKKPCSDSNINYGKIYRFGRQPPLRKDKAQRRENSILPLLAGALLTREKVTIRDCPDISDVAYMCEIIKSLGAVVVRAGDEITISGGAKNGDVPESLAHEIRSSVFLMGSLVATLGRARIAYPGGCDIGLRPVDIHIAR